MKTKDIAFIKILQYINRKGIVTLGGNDGIYQAFDMYVNAQGNYENRGTWPFSPRSLTRYIEEMIELGYLLTGWDNGVKTYSLNETAYFVDLRLSGNDIKELVDSLNSVGEFQLADKMQLLVTEQISKHPEKFNEDTVNKLNLRVDLFPYNLKPVIKTEDEKIIQKAIIESKRVLLKYKGRYYRVLPVAIVKSRVKNEFYLFFVQKRELNPPIILSQVREVSLLEYDNRDKKKWLEEIELRWDIDGGSELEVEAIFWGKGEMLDGFKEYVQERKNATLIYNGECYIFKDKIKGKYDFRNWLRKFGSMVIVDKPVYIQKEMISAAKDKLERYGAVWDG